MLRSVLVLVLVTIFFRVSPICCSPRPVVVQSNAAPPQVVSTNQVITNQVVSNTPANQYIAQPVVTNQINPNNIQPNQVLSPAILNTPVISNQALPSQYYVNQIAAPPCVSNQVLPGPIYTNQIAASPCVSNQVLPGQFYANQIAAPRVTTPILPSPVIAATDTVANSLAHALQLLIVSDLIEHTINSPRGCPPVIDTCVNMVTDCVQKFNPGVFPGAFEIYPGQVVETFAPIDYYTGVTEYIAPVSEFVISQYNGYNTGCCPSSIPAVSTNLEFVKNCGCNNQVPVAYYEYI